MTGLAVRLARLERPLDDAGEIAAILDVIYAARQGRALLKQLKREDGPISPYIAPEDEAAHLDEPAALVLLHALDADDLAALHDGADDRVVDGAELDFAADLEQMLLSPAHRQPANDHRRFCAISRLLALRGIDQPETKAAEVCVHVGLVTRFGPGRWTHAAVPVADAIMREIELLAGTQGDAPDTE
jgi:hypothetical protein